MNRYIVVAFLSLMLSQIIKFIIEIVKTGNINLKRLFNGMGGMPSSHSSFVSSFTMLVYLDYGFDSIYFAISLLFSLIVLYDAIGIRYEVGLHARILNRIDDNVVLKEMIGHSLKEVIWGIILGIVVSIVMFALFNLS